MPLLASAHLDACSTRLAFVGAVSARADSDAARRFAGDETAPPAAAALRKRARLLMPLLASAHLDACSTRLALVGAVRARPVSAGGIPGPSPAGSPAITAHHLLPLRRESARDRLRTPLLASARLDGCSTRLACCR